MRYQFRGSPAREQTSQRGPVLAPWALKAQGWGAGWKRESRASLSSVVLHVDAGPQSLLEIRGAGLPLPAYRTLQLHFHWGGPGQAGSEHSLDGQRRPMEVGLGMG